MELDKNIIETLMNINYFENCRKESKLDIRYGYEFVSIESLKKSLSGVKWGNIELEEVNKLTSYLFFNHNELYQGMWNDLVDKFKEEYMPELDKIILEKVDLLFGDFAKRVMGSIHWDLLHIALAFTYKDYFTTPFYFEILKVYQNGYFPCGWRGKFPKGNMFIY